MRIRYFNIAGVAWSNFKTGFNADGLALFMPYFVPFDVVSAQGCVNVALVTLKRRALDTAGYLKLEVQVSGLMFELCCKGASGRVPRATVWWSTH
jgi:hypothetical protein